MNAVGSQFPDIAVFGHYEAKGGVQRYFANMIKEWTADGYAVEVVNFRNGELFYPQELENLVSCVHLGVRNKFAATLKLWMYLFKKQPKVIISTAHIDNKIVSYLSYFPGIRTLRFVSVHNTYGKSGRRDHSGRARKVDETRRLYRYNHGVIAASGGIKSDLQDNIGLKDVPVHVVLNGAITRETLERSRERVDHPWLNDQQGIPVFITAGGLRQQKDHKNLIDAFAAVRSRKECRLIILGEGPLREELTERARKRGIAEDIDLYGFVDNPYAWMAKADCFVLSSLWEGLPTVLIEALSLGVPIVSTDCPSGPGEILQNGNYGKLVPMSDSEALANAIERTLTGEVEGFDPLKAVEPFMARYASRRYLQVFGLLEKGEST